MRGEPLCEKALLRITEQRLLVPGDRVIVALSGGADSVALLAVLQTLAQPLALCGVEAVHINHRLRGEEAERDEAFVRELCKQRGISLTVFRRDVAALSKEAGCGVEEMGRQVRYACFDEMRNGRENVKIATAHTLSDQAETVLLHLCRGCGTQGLGGIPTQRGAIIRPLLDCSREEIEAFCEKQGLAFVTDSTNADTVYSRNFIRHEVLPRLAVINPKVQQALSRMAQQAQQDEVYLSDCAAQALRQLPQENGCVDVKVLAALPSALLSRVLRHLCVSAGASPETFHITALMRALYNRERCVIPLPGKVQAVCTTRWFYAAPSDVAVWTPCAVKANEPIAFYGRTCICSIVDAKKYKEIQKIHKKLVKFSCDYDKIKGVVTLDVRRNGDVIRPAGGVGSKTLKKWFNEKKIPSPLRGTLPVLRDEEGILLVAGVGCDQRVQVDDTTKRWLIWQVL